MGVYTYYSNNATTLWPGNKMWPTAVRTVNVESSITAVQVNGYIFGSAQTTPSGPTSTSPTSSSAPFPSNTTPPVASNTLGSTPDVTFISSQQNEEGKDSGLLTSAKVSIGVGVSVGVIGIAALLVVGLIWRRRRMNASKSKDDPMIEEKSNTSTTMDYSAFAPSKSSYYNRPDDARSTLLVNNQAHEVHEVGTREPQEMSVERRMQELP